MRVKSFSIVIVILSALALSACKNSEKQENASVADTPVKLALYWWPEIEFAPFYAALKQDYFGDEHLDVTIINGGYDADGKFIEVLPQVLNGTVDFGIAGSDQILQARAAGEPLVAVATLFQRFPTGLASLGSSNIQVPSDLRGKRILLWGEDSSYDMFLHQTGLQPSDVIEVQGDDIEGGYSTSHLVNGDVDAMILFLNAQYVFVLRSLVPDQDINLLPFFDYGVPGYPDVIFTTEQMIKDHPDRVQAFVNATLRGIRYAVENPTVISDYYYDNYRDPNQNEVREIVHESMQATLPYFLPGGSTPGIMQAEIWETQYNTLLEIGQISAPFDWHDAFDLRFLEAAK